MKIPNLKEQLIFDKKTGELIIKNNKIFSKRLVEQSCRKMFSETEVKKLLKKQVEMCAIIPLLSKALPTLKLQ
jgi:hypothetical protein